MKTLLIDATAMTVNPKGVGKYAYEVTKRLDQVLPDCWHIMLVVFRGSQLPVNWSKRVTALEIATQSDLKLGLYTMANLIVSHDADILLRMGDSSGKVYRIPTITVCHDINSFIVKAQRSRLSIFRLPIDYSKEYFRILALESSAIVICNSTFTREEVVKNHRISFDKTAIGYCGIDEIFYRADRLKAIQRTKDTFGCEGYVLTFATGDPRENYDTIPDVIAATKRLGQNVQYVIAGVDKNSQYFRVLEEKLLQHALVEGQDYVFVPFLGTGRQQQLCDLYTAADYYLELSLHEGFGMQLAEAMACGTTCIGSDHSALPEVGGRFMLCTDQEDPDGIAQMITQGYQRNEHLKDHWDQVQYTHRFSWDDTAKVIAVHLMSLLESQA
jgi:glycosyltransferase involved in cell wall biosynthesis